MTDFEKKCISSCIEKDPCGTIAQFAGAIGEESTFALLKNFGGTHIYLPKIDTINRQSRNKRIIDDFNRGMSFREMSQKYGISDRTIRGIVNKK